MAKYVLVAFDKDEDADAFVKTVQDNREVLAGYHYDPMIFEATVRGVWRKPTKFCDCKGHSGPYTRGQKYGWWVHVKCKKPMKTWIIGHMWYTALGTNLLPISDDAPEYRGPGHKQHPGWQPPMADKPEGLDNALEAESRSRTPMTGV